MKFLAAIFVTLTLSAFLPDSEFFIYKGKPYVRTSSAKGEVVAYSLWAAQIPHKHSGDRLISFEGIVLADC
jgi:hypothetical protein